MDEWERVSGIAVNRAKAKVQANIDGFMEGSKQVPSLAKYLAANEEYLQDLWKQEWKHHVKNGFSNVFKRSYLEQKGFNTGEMNRKKLNQEFIRAMDDNSSFYVIDWIHSEFDNQEEKWKRRYDAVQKRYQHKLALQEKARLERERQRKIRHLEEGIWSEVSDMIEAERDSLYVRVRFEIARKLADAASQPASYKIGNDVMRMLAGIILERLTPNLRVEYKHLYAEDMTAMALQKIAGDQLVELKWDFEEELSEEKPADLLHLASIGPSFEEQQALYDQLKAEKEREKREIQAELELKRQKEKRLISEIFEPEYDFSIRRHIQYRLHIGDTNTGKTFQALERMKQAESGLYLAPLRLLALEVYERLNSEGIACNLKTGEEEKKVEGALRYSCTVEMFHEKDHYDVIVIDEAQMIADKDRGFSWFKAITTANANEVHIIGSQNIKGMLLYLLQGADIHIREYRRNIPLEVQDKPFKIKDVRQGDALICFSRNRVLQTAAKLEKDGHKVSIIYGSMPPETRQKQIERFIQGNSKVIVATDAIGMGLNLPVRRVVFLENEKFDGRRRRPLTSQEVKQIAGRAGRKGIYDVGFVAFSQDVKKMKRILAQKDEPVRIFTIAPTRGVFERFLSHHHNLGTFFELWNKFENPRGTRKAALLQEMELYHSIKGTEIEQRLSLMDLYGYLHMPFSANEPVLKQQWQATMMAMVRGEELPEPETEHGSLEELELSYKIVGLHLLFLYKLDKQTEAHYWERVREEISDEIHELLRKDIKRFKKICKYCGCDLSWDYPYSMCNKCHNQRQRRRYSDEEDWY